MASEPFYTRTEALTRRPVGELTDDQLPAAAAIVVGDIIAVTDMRGMGVPKTGVLDPTTARVLEVITDFPVRHAAAVQRAAYLGYPWTDEAQARNEQVMTAFVAGIDDQPRVESVDFVVPTMNLEPRPDFVHIMGEDGRAIYDDILNERFCRLVPELVTLITDRVPVANADLLGVMQVAGEIANAMLGERELGTQFGFDAADVEHQRQLDQLRMQGPEGRGGSY